VVSVYVVSAVDVVVVLERSNKKDLTREKYDSFLYADLWMAINQSICFVCTDNVGYGRLVVLWRTMQSTCRGSGMSMTRLV
jgi:hypothetical protein